MVFTPNAFIESNLDNMPARLPPELKQRIFTWYIIASCLSGTPLNGVPYCVGWVSTIIGGVTTTGAVSPFLLQESNMQVNTIKRNCFIK